MTEVKRLDLGAVSAYALAVEKGYTGTEEEFVEILTNALNYATQAQESASAAAGSAEEAGNYKTQAREILANVNLAGTQQIEAIEAAGTQQTDAAKEAIEAKGKETLDSIPDSYEALQGDVTQLRGDLGGLSEEIFYKNQLEPTEIMEGYAITAEYGVFKYEGGTVKRYTMTAETTYEQNGAYRIAVGNYASGASATYVGEDKQYTSDGTYTYLFIYGANAEIYDVASEIETLKNRLDNGEVFVAIEPIPYDGYAVYKSTSTIIALDGYTCYRYRLNVGEEYIVKTTGGKTALISDSDFARNRTGEIITLEAGSYVPTKPYLYTTKGKTFNIGKIEPVVFDDKKSREFNTINIAAYDATAEEKINADLVCDGEDDAVYIRKAIEMLPSGGTINLSTGVFYLNSVVQDYDGVYRAITIPGNTDNGDTRAKIDYAIRGQGMKNTRLQVTDALYDAMDVNNEYELIGAPAFTRGDGKFSACGLRLSNMRIRTNHNQKPVIFVNLQEIGRATIERVSLHAYNFSNREYATVPNEKCIGLRMFNGWNNGVENLFVGIVASGFHEGFQVGAEHIVMINCSAIKNVYGYTFGNYDWGFCFCHPITMINCCDERNTYMPKFVKSGQHNADGSYSGTGTNAQLIQNISMIDFNLERSVDQCPGQIFVDAGCVVEDDIYFCGTITYTMQSGGLDSNYNLATQFFSQGGKNFKVRNLRHKLYGSTALRQSYGANNMQEYYDTDIKKMLWYFDDAWHDATGNVVD